MGPSMKLLLTVVALLPGGLLVAPLLYLARRRQARLAPKAAVVDAVVVSDAVV